MKPTPTPTERAPLVIQSGKNRGRYWADLWAYRELFLFLSWRDVLVRYKQTAMGMAWALLRPFLTMVAFFVVFGRIANLPDGGVPYPALVMAGLLAWQLFSTALGEGAQSLVSNANLISKVYFPRILVPASSYLVALLDFAFALAIYVAIALYDRIHPGVAFFSLPLWVLLCLGLSFGLALWFAALNVQYRDFRYVVPFVTQFGLYISPVGYASNAVPEKWKFAFQWNPMVGVIDGFRWCLIPNAPPPAPTALAISCAMAAFLILTGFAYFRRMERSFADVI